MIIACIKLRFWCSLFAARSSESWDPHAAVRSVFLVYWLFQPPATWVCTILGQFCSLGCWDWSR
jgi:hypothetical protein